MVPEEGFPRDVPERLREVASVPRAPAASEAACRILVDSFGTSRIEARRSETAGVADSNGKVKEAVVGGRDFGVFKAGPGEAGRQAGSILVCRDLRESSDEARSSQGKSPVQE